MCTIVIYRCTRAPLFSVYHCRTLVPVNQSVFYFMSVHTEVILDKKKTKGTACTRVVSVNTIVAYVYRCRMHHPWAPVLCVYHHSTSGVTVHQCCLCTIILYVHLYRQCAPLLSVYHHSLSVPLSLVCTDVVCAPSFFMCTSIVSVHQCCLCTIILYVHLYR